MRVDLTEITWEAVAAVATLAAVVVALVPIWRDAARRRSHARSLRLRLCSKLSLLRPSLGKVMRGGHSNHPSAVLTKDEFRETVRSIASMMEESAVLESDEQDQLGIALANLEMASALYDGPLFAEDSAKNTLALVDIAVAAMERHGLLHGAVEKPWAE